MSNSDEINEKAVTVVAVALVAEACASVPQQRAMAAAVMRIAGNALAKLSSEEDAFLTHTTLARRHQERMGHRGQRR